MKRNDLMDILVSPLEKSLFTITTEKEEAITALFMDWFTNTAQLKPVPDLQQRLMAMEPKLRRMAKNLKLSFQKGKLVIKSDADSEALLGLLRRGSDWFEPHRSVEAVILLGLSSGK